MNDHTAKAFLTNFGTKVFHSLGDGETAKWASDLLGMRLEEFISVTPKPDQGMGERMFDSTGVSSTVSRSYQPILQPAVFTCLRTGGPPDFIVTGIVIRNGEPFQGSAENWLLVEFSQR